MIAIANNFNSRITVGDTLQNVLTYVPKEQRNHLVMVTDSKVYDLYHESFPEGQVFIMGQTEANKTQATIDELTTQLLELGVDRHWFMIGIGGGIVCDVTGYLASVYMRGIACGYVPTTLLAQVDASVGGKTGINFRGYKNIIGTFKQPQFVLCDTHLLQSLPEKEIKNGLAEAIKHGIISSVELFNFIEKELDSLLRKDVEALTKVVEECVTIKSSIVELDEREKGERKKLNLGHSFGHAIESLELIPHGHAVIKGLLLASELSAIKNYCSWETHSKIKDLLMQLNVSLNPRYSVQKMLTQMQKDKKKQIDRIDFVYIQHLGKVTVIPTLFDELIIERKHEKAQ